MKKNINNIWEQICSYFSNDLSTKQESNLKAEIQNSEHADLFTAIENDCNLIETSQYMYDEETNKAWDTLHSNLLNKQRESETIRFYQRPLLKVAASILILFGLGWLGYLSIQSIYLNNTELRTAYSTQVLPDGTTVYLNKDSEIKYPEKFSGDTREVHLSGEAYFNVAKNPNKPFIIKSSNAIIKVLGTSFNVNTNSSINTTEVLVESGTVSVSDLRKSHELILTKGQAALVKNSQVIETKITDVNYLSWKTQLLDFRNDHLQYVIKVLNKTYPQNIKLDLKKPSDFKLYSKFDKVPLNTVLKSICLIFDLEYKYVDKDVIITNKSD